MAIQTINPATAEVVKTYDEFSPEKLEQVIATAHSAYKNWKSVPVAERAIFMGKVADVLRSKKEEMAKVITLEMGKRIHESRLEIQLCIDIFQYYADNGAKILANKPIESRLGNGYLHYEGQGIVLAVEPWNFPMYQMTRATAPNVIGGNAVLVKQASNVPLCSIEFAKWFTEAGIPEGVVTALLLSGSKIEPLLADDRIIGATLTGSNRSGASVAAAAGQNNKKSVMELGGNDAFYVTDEFPMDKAIDIAYIARLENCGQKCISGKRIILHEKIADEFMQELTAKINSLKAGDPLDECTTLQPMNTEKAMNTVLDQVKRAVAGGATLLQGGTRMDRAGYYIEPAIIKGMTPDNPLFDEEIFGPVVVYYIVKNDEEAISLANNSQYGLGGSILCTNIDRAKQIAEKIETGMMYINTPTLSFPEIPFGGIKKSGFGHELYSDGVYEFLTKKLIVVREELDVVEKFF